MVRTTVRLGSLAASAASAALLVGALASDATAQVQPGDADLAVSIGGGAEAPGEQYITLVVEEEDIRSVAAKIAKKAGVNIQVDRQVEALVTVKLTNLPWRLVLEAVARDANVEIEERGARLFYLTQPPRVTMEFVEADLRLVLDQLARLASKNIVLSPVIGERKVTLNLRNVHWFRALETIVKTVGLVAVREEDIVRIVRPEDLVAQLELRSYGLNYLRPPDDYKASIPDLQGGGGGGGGAGGGAGGAGGGTSAGGQFFVARRAAPNGLEDFTILKALKATVNEKIGEKVDYNIESNTFFVRATAKTHTEIETLLRKVDVEPQQVFIDVKFISTRNTNFIRDGLKAGIAGRRTGEPAGAGFNAGLITSGGVATPSPTPGFAAAAIGQFPFFFGEGVDAFTEAFRIPAILDFSQFNLVLQYVDIDQNSKVTQAPHLLTLNDREAVIFVGENVPFAEQTANQDQNGNITVTLKEGAQSPVSVGFTLFITPHIVRDTDQIILTVIPRVSRLTGTQPNGLERFSFVDPRTGIQTFIDLPRVADQVVVTKLLIRDNNTAVIGGLMQETVTEIEERIPILSSIPFIGDMFTFDSKDYAQENLIIFITPRIIRNAQDASDVFATQYKIHQGNDWFYLKYLKDAEKAEEKKYRGSKPATTSPQPASTPDESDGAGAPARLGADEGRTGGGTTPPPAEPPAPPPPSPGPGGDASTPPPGDR